VIDFTVYLNSDLKIDNNSISKQKRINRLQKSFELNDFLLQNGVTPKKDTKVYCTQISTTLLFNFNDLMDIIIK